jgi:SdrD B-like domain
MKVLLTSFKALLLVKNSKLCLLFFFLCFFLAASSFAQTISGTVFNDGNNNGVKDATDVGFPNATIKAYIVGSTVVSTTTAANDGTYTLTGLSAGTKYRIEFTPFLGYNDGAVGTSSASSIQFATAGATNVNFGIFLPGKCGTDPDPRLIGSCGLFPDPLNPPATPPSVSVASWRYQTDFYPQTKWGAFNYATVQPHQDDLLATQVGVPWAMARVPNTNYVLMVPISSPETSVFASGGVSGTTAIYMVDYSGANAAYSTHKTLVQLSAVGFPLTAVNPIGAVQPRFGEYGLGGIAVSPDAKYVYVANLGKGNIMRIDISGVTYGSLPATAPAAGNITEINFPTSIAGFTSGTDGYFRATAMKRHGDDIYIAGTFDGSLRADNSAVRVVVFKLNVATNALTEAFSFNPIAFDAGNINTAPVPQKRWMAGPDNSDATIGGKETKYIQPVVSGFDFDNYGAITLGITNRGVYNLNTANEVGYVVSTWRNADGTYTLENAGARGSLTAANTSTTMHDTFGTGPGGNVFYDQSIGHPYLFSGGLLNITSKNVMAMGLTDPMMVQSFGVRYDQQSDGGIIGGIGLGGGKLFALVGVDAVCAIKDPIEVGNYIWKDSNDNGIMDGSELPLVGVTVELLNSGGTVIATATTDANGNYIFSSDPNRTSTASHKYNLTQLTPQTNFTIRIPNASGGSIQTPLTGLYVTLSNQGTNDLVDSDGTLSGTSDTYSFTLGSEGQNNHSIDFGFGTTPTCTPPTATAAAVQPSCTGTNAPNNGGITITGGTGLRYQYTSGSTFSGTATPASITAIPGSGIITSTLANTSGSYTVRIYDAADATCYVDRVVTITAVVCCTAPTATAAAVQPSCTGTNAPNNGGITITGGTGLRYQYTSGSTFSGTATPASITVIPGSGIITSTLANTSGSYTVRIYDATNDACYVDRVVTITAVVCCTAPTATAAGTNATCSIPNANSDAKITIANFTAGQRYQYSAGGTFNSGSALPSSLMAIPVSGVIVNNLSNTTSTYTVRIYDATNASCYVDRVVNITATNCGCPILGSPIVNDAIRCGSGTVTTTISTACLAGSTFKIFSDAALTTDVTNQFIIAGANITSGVLSMPAFYFAACQDNLSTVCNSPADDFVLFVAELPTSATPSTLAGTCNGATLNNDASIMLADVVGDRVGISTAGAASYNGPTYTLANTLTSTSFTFSNLQHSTVYYIRIYNTEGCFSDIAVTTADKTCCASPNCGTVTVIKN